MKKFALGIHHFNILYTVGSISTYHRVVREGIVPLLDLLHRHPTWKFSIEMSGASIEFLAQEYSDVLERLKFLISNNQVEFISSTYSPQAWISFPKIDMIRSIEMNLEVLDKNSILPSRIFFSQENFSGEGIKTLKDWYDTAIVKEDYYYYINEKPKDLNSIPPYFRLGGENGINVAIGWGHILEGIANELHSELPHSQFTNGDFVLNAHRNMLRAANVNFQKKNKLQDHVGRFKDIEWKWYHVGSSERFGKASRRPGDINEYRFDPIWHFLLEEYLGSMENNGYRFSGVKDFIDEVNLAEFKPKPSGLLLDGAWNMQDSMGGYVWSGYNSNLHEDDLLVRNHNWRSRSRLLALETLCKLTEAEDLIPSIAQDIKEIWKDQLLAEASDATGWISEKCEVSFSIDKSEDVLNATSKISNQIKSARNMGAFAIDCYNQILNDPRSINKKISKLGEEPLASIELFGAVGAVNFYTADVETQRVYVDFIPSENPCGVRVGFDLSAIIYSPALMESDLVDYDLEMCRNNLTFLALPNGLIGISEGVFLIKHNEYVSIAGCVSKTPKELLFKITNPHKRIVKWVFTLFKGNRNDALKLANTINVFPTVIL